MPKTKTKGKLSPKKHEVVEAKPQSSGRKRGKAKTEVQAKKMKKDPDPGDQDIKKLSFSGLVPIDEHCKECATGYHVFTDYYFTLGVTYGTLQIYDVMLNQTNIGEDENNNKYYIIQILKHDTKQEYVTWSRWGRVGKIGGTSLKRHGSDLEEARTLFCKKFREKTGNTFWWRRPFLKQPGKYEMVEIDYGQNQEQKVTPKASKKQTGQTKQKEVPSTLDKRVQDVIDMIFDVNNLEECVKELEFDVKKAPLGKLTTKQIKSGYDALAKIDDLISKKDFGKSLSDACGAFYTKIPHDFGSKKPPLINTPELVQQKADLLEALSDIQIAMRMIEDDDGDEDVNIKDKWYKSLGCTLLPLEKSDTDYKMVQQYVKNSHASTHNQYSLSVETIYAVERNEDQKRFKRDIGNRMLLWHGSRLTNWCRILKEGLKIAPPEAPNTGYMFGKGVYFADMVSKSANYCFASKRQPCGFLLLCEVALGKSSEKLFQDYNAAKLPRGISSVKGVGREFPDSKGHKTLDCGTVAPLGKRKKISSPTGQLLYNEYVVYDVKQIKARYLVKVKFTGRNW